MPLQSPPLLPELRAEQFNLWRHHPVTRLVFDDYLESLTTLIELQVLNGWLSGNATLQAEQEARGRVIAHRLLIQNLNLSVIREHFGLPGVPDDAR